MLSRTFILPSKANTNLFYFPGYKVLTIKLFGSNEKYLLIPLIAHVKKVNAVVTISIDRSKIKFSNYRVFCRLFKFWVYQFRFLKKRSFKTILIRGVGLRVFFLENSSNILQLKLGFSHFIFLTVPKGITVIILKKKIIIEGLNVISIGNFSKKIMSFKTINSFTGKGLWLKNIQKFYCKPVKKR